MTIEDLQQMKLTIWTKRLTIAVYEEANSNECQMTGSFKTGYADAQESKSHLTVLESEFIYAVSEYREMNMDQVEFIMNSGNEESRANLLALTNHCI